MATMKQTERNIWLDASLAVIFVSTAFTGFILWLAMPHQASSEFWGLNRYLWLSIHIGSGLASVAGSVLHVIWHRLWLKALRGRRIASLSAKVRSNRVVDRFVWIAFIATNVFAGLNLIFPAGGNGASVPDRLHVAFAMACLLGITIHLALHSKWIATTIKNCHQAKREDTAIIQPGGVKN
jgi:hypothetical protein